MVRIGTVWDRTMEVIAGRFTILAGIALLFLFVPAVIQSGFDAYTVEGSTMRMVAGLVGIVATLVLIIGTLALTAVATDPAVDRAEATAIGTRRLGPAIGIGILVGLVAGLAFVPGLFLLIGAGFDVTRAQAGLMQDNVNSGMVAAAGMYFLVMLVFLLWLSARLVPLMGVIVNERRGIGAIARSFALTRGATLKLVGVMILYGVVLSVLSLAVISIVGLIVRILVGADGLATVAFVSGVAMAVVTSVFGVLQAVFSGQFYVAARELRDPA